MILNDVVDAAFFINLDRRPDRLIHARNELANNNIKAKRYCAVDGNSINLYPNLSRGAAGCLESQRSIINLGISNNYETIAIFEDDVFFVENFEEKFAKFYSQVPEDWQFIFLANNKFNANINRISENVEKVSGAWSAHALLMRREAMIAASEIISDGDLPVDVYYGILQQHYPAYSAVPSLAGQRADHSDIENVFIDYNRIYGL